MLVLLLLLYLLYHYLVRRWKAVKESYRQRENIPEDAKVVAFFHPYCHAGGGGERVLWAAIQALQLRFPQHHYVIYAEDQPSISDEMIIEQAERNFQIVLPQPVRFIRLRRCYFLRPERYPVATLLLQNIGFMVVGFEAAGMCVPDVFIDTIGASFLYPLFRYIGKSAVVAYVHYPIMHRTMLTIVTDGVENFNNSSLVAKHFLLKELKFVYYRLFAFLYRLVGNRAAVVMANSTWTREHLMDVWKNDQIHLVYPPCTVERLKKLPLVGKERQRIISIGQFRPEKNHALQLEAFKLLLATKGKDVDGNGPKLIIMGGCRNEEDVARVKKLQALAETLAISDCVEFHLNVSFEKMLAEMAKASIAIHTMQYEHFGIVVVDFLAAGLLTIAHKSGGPKEDIIEHNRTGFLATTDAGFAEKMCELMEINENEMMDIRERARASIDRFTEEKFADSFLKAIEPVMI